MGNSVIEVSGLSKYYRLGTIGGGTLSDDIKSYIARLRGKKDPAALVTDKAKGKHGDSIMALEDINFEVSQGEALGIIGHNGAGKSTLLKLLSRITLPSAGSIRIRGRIAALLEVGTGFHPELTGRENIFLNGAILGMTKSEIQRKLDEIIDFSGVEKFVDTPVKRYSSGMRVRLAFAVAAHLDPEIMVIDEVLAVGDAEFQRKCIGKMEDVSSREGRTVLFVSHTMNAVNNLCTRAIVLNQGKLVFNGKTSEAIGFYVNNLAQAEDNQTARVTFDREEKKMQIRELSLLNSSGDLTKTFSYQDPVHLNIRFDINQEGKGYYVLGQLKDTMGNLLFTFANDDEGPSELSDLTTGSYAYNVVLPTRLLKPGKYNITLGLTERNAGPVDKKESILSFEIFDHISHRGLNNGYRKNAVVAPEVPWKLTRLNPVVH